jgi:hypothetical protein
MIFGWLFLAVFPVLGFLIGRMGVCGCYGRLWVDGFFERTRVIPCILCWVWVLGLSLIIDGFVC